MYKITYKPNIIIEREIEANSEEEAAEKFISLMEEINKGLWKMNVIVDEKNKFEVNFSK